MKLPRNTFAGSMMFGIAIVLICTASCSKSNNQSLINPDTGKHSSTWLTDHRASYLSDPNACSECHGSDLHGGISGVSCFSASYNGVSCHANGPAGHPSGWSSPDSHGASAKSAPSTTNFTGFSTCQICHGSDFTGGLAGQTCLSAVGCHGASVAAPHSPSPWLSSPTSTRTHATTNNQNAPVCGLCHLGNRTPPAYAALTSGSQPDCYNNSLCHGSDVVPHALPYTDPLLHGPAAKADLTFCEGCHASPSNGGAGSNPRFNVAIGNLSAGCESSGCHDASYAHPTQWRGLTATAPGGHMTAGNLANACALCHGVDLAGGAGPACSTCHTAGSPLTMTNCTSCHGNPPDGSVSPNRSGSHSIHDNLVSATVSSASAICAVCHNGGGTGTANHDYGRNAVYMSFGSSYNANSGSASYNAATDTCANISCHGSSRTQTASQGSSRTSTPGNTPAWITGAIDVNTQCTLCHVLGSSAGSPENNSYYSGQHDLHVYGEASSAFGSSTCTICHDTTRLAAVHFTSLTAPISEATASATTSKLIQFNGSTCNPSAGGLSNCHGSHSW